MKPGRVLCRLGYHDWRVTSRLGPGLFDGRMFRQVGDRVPCRRGCGAVLVAVRGKGWVREDRS